MGLFYCLKQLEVVGKVAVGCQFQRPVEWLISGNSDRRIGITLVVFDGDIAVNFLRIFGVQGRIHHIGKLRHGGVSDIDCGVRVFIEKRQKRLS